MILSLGGGLGGINSALPLQTGVFFADIMELASQIDRQFADVLAEIELFERDGVSCNKPKITTATIVCVLPTACDINFNDIRNNPLVQVRQSKTRRGKETYRAFSNSITVLFRTKAIKVFVNGTLHITGCNKMCAAMEHVKELCDAMQWTFAPASLKILTLNTSFSIVPRRHINLETFYKFMLREKKEAVCRYNPDIYQGLVVKLTHPYGQNMISILIFYTGTMIITGVRQCTELGYSHTYIMRCLCECGPFM